MSEPRIVGKRRAGAVLVSAALLLPFSNGLAHGQTTQAQDADGAKATYLRVVEEPGQSIALEIAAQSFVPTDGSGPTVSIVGVSHIGEPELYTQLQAILNEYDIVLYESVMPPGGDGASGDDDEQRAASTKQAMELVTAAIATHHAQTGGYPQDHKQLLSFAAKHDPRLEDWLTNASVDGWKRPLVYNSGDDLQSFTLVSLGADGKVGGEGAAADLEMSHENSGEVAGFLSEEDNLQAQLASTLGLEFQLEAIDYGQPNWRCSDMTVVQLEEAMLEKGVDFAPFQGALAGTSWPAKLVGYILKFVQAADVFMDGAISDTIKVLLIEMFSDETMLKQGLQQFGAGFEEVIVDQRNQIVIDEIKSILAQEPDIESVGVFYGAAHMPDMADRLREQLGYEASEQTWVTAIEVDLTKSAVPPAQLEFLRQMLKRQMKQQWGSAQNQEQQ